MPQKEESEEKPIDANYQRIKTWEEECTRETDRALIGFPLPIRIRSVDDYDVKVAEELKRYIKSIEETPALMRISGLLGGVQDIVGGILSSLHAERKGDTENARKTIMSILKKYREDKFFVSELDSNYAFRAVAPFTDLRSDWLDYDRQLKYPLSFFRCREGEIETREEMLHVPLSKRSWSSSNRFSLPGIPCLYLATTTYCCWKELGEPIDMSAVAFRLNEEGKKLKILNLVISQRLISGVDWPPYDPMNILAYKMRLLFPLVIATSFSEEEQKSCRYNPEYTISHLIMRCLEELGIDGVAYLSSRINNEFPSPLNVNLAIPIFSGSVQQEYGEICRCFEMTSPLFFKDVEQSDSKIEYNSNHKSYINAVYQVGILATIKDFGTRYSESPFFNIDNKLTGRPYYPALK